MVRAYILVTTEVGKMREVFEQLEKIESVKEIDMLTGPYDLIVQAEAEDMTDLTDGIVERIRDADGVKDTTTNIVIEGSA